MSTHCSDFSFFFSKHQFCCPVQTPPNGNKLPFSSIFPQFAEDQGTYAFPTCYADADAFHPPLNKLYTERIQSMLVVLKGEKQAYRRALKTHLILLIMRLQTKQELLVKAREVKTLFTQPLLCLKEKLLRDNKTQLEGLITPFHTTHSLPTLTC